MLGDHGFQVSTTVIFHDMIRSLTIHFAKGHRQVELIPSEESCLARLQDQETTRGQNIQNEYKQQIISASQLLRKTLGERSSLDLTSQREACFQAVDTWLQGVHSAFIQAHRSEPPPPAQDQKVSDSMIEIFQQVFKTWVLRSWAKCIKTTPDAWAADPE